jgi:hypothetical protein
MNHTPQSEIHHLRRESHAGTRSAPRRHRPPAFSAMHDRQTFIIKNDERWRAISLVIGGRKIRVLQPGEQFVIPEVLSDLTVRFARRRAVNKGTK